MAEKLSDQEIVRRQKMQDLIDKGIKPFGHAYNRTHHSAQLKNLYGEKTKEELEAAAEGMEDARDAVELILSDGIQKAMNRYNGKKK